MSVPRVADVAAALERLYPPGLAEPWDTGIGLTCGDRDAEVRRVHFAVDASPEVVDEAVAGGSDLLVTHHPVLFRPVTSLSGSASGRVVQRAIRAGVALFAAHTNADAGRPGVSDALAAAIGLNDVTALVPSAGSGDDLDVLVTYVPVGSATGGGGLDATFLEGTFLEGTGVEGTGVGGTVLDGTVARVVDALGAAGAGRIGNYTRCAYASPGEGTFRPGDGASPSVGSVGAVARVPEVRIEMVLPRACRAAVLAALRATHPYEEPAFHFVRHDALPAERTDGFGLGRVGDLPRATTLGELAAHVARALPVGPAGVRYAGDKDAPVRRIAVCGGAGDNLLSDVAHSGADAYVTADLRHHLTQDALAERGTGALRGLLDAGHWATEWPWLATAADALVAELGRHGLGPVDVTVSRRRTDPWSGLATGEGNVREG